MKTWLITFLAGSVGWYAISDPQQIAASSAPARIDIAWTASNAFGTYHLRGRFVIRGLNDGSSTSVSNESQPNITHSEIEVRPGLYSLTLEDGFQLARKREADTTAVRSSLSSSNPLIVVAQPGRVVPATLSLIALREPAGTDAPCVN
ncbi:MAG: hypothetical protein RL033_7292 [Pseudomonadota bacterium]|jgi:hypothetical protein